MKKLMFVLVIVALLMGATGVLAGGPPKGKRGRKGQAGKSNAAFIELWEKIQGPPEDPCAWKIDEDGAWGKMKYNLAGPTFDFVFNGHKLDPNTEYSLIYYADPWPGNHPGKLIATGTPNAGGNLHLQDSVELGMDLPDSGDANYPDGAKIWLIPSDAYDADTYSVTSWPADPDKPPDGWLFEYDLITFDDTDV